MISNTLKRLATGLCLALLLAAVTFAIGRAQDAVPTTAAEAGEIGRQCADCHSEIQTNWQVSAHGQATVDEVFVRAWEARDKSPECLTCHTTGFNLATNSYEQPGVTCDACHTMVENGPNHPEQIMTTDYTAASCGTCHVDTYNQWQVSQHGESEMNCINCHNPHSTTIKADTVQTLCKTCHTTEGHFYTYTAHAEEGLLCTDCHLQVMPGEPGEGHGKRAHTFAVDLETCNECHQHEMHAAGGQMSAIGGTAGSAGSDDNPSAPAGSSTITTHPIQAQPRPASYLNFALLAGLIGLAFGAVGSPWVERGLRLILVGAK
jgi:hypothetical protein